MKNKSIEKHLRVDYILSCTILFCMVASISILIIGFLVKNSHKTIKIQISNVIFSIILSFFVTKRFSFRFDMFLHKYIYKNIL